ncbi:MAG: LysM peptidoglycan-binding domain-containing protein, partial [Nitrospirae bacterium]
RAPLRAELARHFAAVLADAGRLAQWRDAYLHRRRDWLEGTLARAARLQPRFQAVFESMGLPRVLSYLPMVESGFRPHATSIMAAGGYWQFIPSTARHFGLTLDRWVDERRDPEASTRAAGRYLKRLHRTFGDWPLALMAYNSGEGRVLGILRRLGTRDYREVVRSVRTPAETAGYVAGFVAAVQIALDPEQYGVTPPPLPPPEPPVAVVPVRGSIDLTFVARATGVSLSELRRLNPALLMGCTPPREEPYPLRVPATAAAGLRARLASQPQTLYTRWTTHRIRRGEALRSIARRYGIPMEAIARFNRLKDPRLIRAGAELVIPIPEGRHLPRRLRRRRHRPPAQRDIQRLTYTVRTGDSLWSIARRYGTTAERLRRWNSLLRREPIHPGERLTLYVAKGTRPKARRHRHRRRWRPGEPLPPDYRVVAGDSLWSIARRYGLAVEELARWNGLSTRATLHPGQVLRLKQRPFILHRVRRGESLWQIARRYKTSVQAIRRHNRLGPKATIHPGDRLKIPASSPG